MADEADIVEVAGNPVPDSELTASSDDVVTEAPEVAEEEVAPKTFTQEELDDFIAKRLSKEERKWQRKLDALKRTPDDPPAKPEQGDDVEAYAEARAKQLVEQQRQSESKAAMLEAYHEREEVAQERYDDFEQVAYNPKLSITPVMAETIQASDQGPDVIYWLGSNPKEADRIAKLAPFLQAKEIGKIEAKLADNPPTKKTTSAPDPISPVTAKTNGATVYDTTDPRSIKSMTTSEWIEAERKRQTKNWEAARRSG